MAWNSQERYACHKILVLPSVASALDKMAPILTKHERHEMTGARSQSWTVKLQHSKERYKRSLTFMRPAGHPRMTSPQGVKPIHLGFGSNPFLNNTSGLCHLLLAMKPQETPLPLGLSVFIPLGSSNCHPTKAAAFLSNLLSHSPGCILHSGYI